MKNYDVPFSEEIKERFLKLALEDKFSTLSLLNDRIAELKMKALTPLDDDFIQVQINDLESMRAFFYKIYLSAKNNVSQGKSTVSKPKERQ